MVPQGIFPAQVVDPEHGMRHEAHGVQGIGPNYQRYDHGRAGVLPLTLCFPRGRQRRRGQASKASVAEDTGGDTQQAQRDPSCHQAYLKQYRHH